MRSSVSSWIMAIIYEHSERKTSFNNICKRIKNILKLGKNHSFEKKGWRCGVGLYLMKLTKGSLFFEEIKRKISVTFALLKCIKRLRLQRIFLVRQPIQDSLSALKQQYYLMKTSEAHWWFHQQLGWLCHWLHLCTHWGIQPRYQWVLHWPRHWIHHCPKDRANQTENNFKVRVLNDLVQYLPPPLQESLQ